MITSTTILDEMTKDKWLPYGLYEGSCLICCDETLQTHDNPKSQETLLYILRTTTTAAATTTTTTTASSPFHTF
jgi:hypothetical protein